MPGSAAERTATFEDPAAAITAALLLLDDAWPGQGQPFSVAISTGVPAAAGAQAMALAARCPPGSVTLDATAMHALGRAVPPRMALHPEEIETEDGTMIGFVLRAAGEVVPSSLPIPSTRLIGRQAQLRELRRILSDERLVTLTGPPGSGKTRLAIELAHDVLGAFQDGAWFVPLAPIQDPALIGLAVGQTLAVKEEAGRPMSELVSEHMESRDLLLVLDNFEHVVEGASVLADWLGHAPRLRILATSRAGLHLSGEREFAVPPLTLPDDPTDPQAGESEAVRLFSDRAQAVAADFVVDATTLPEVAHICRRLDGLPLALEIAAARAKALPVAAIRTRLDHSLDLLTHAVRDVPDRHRSLHAAVSWSYGLLTPIQQAVLRRLSVFRGGWDLDAADAVTAATDELGADLLETLTAILDESLIRRQPGAAGEARYDMLETLREFGRERLIDAGEADATATRHAAWFCDMAERAEPHLTGREQGASLDRMDRDADNLRAALRWAIHRRDGELGMRLAAALWRFWQLRGHINEGRQLLDELMALEVKVSPRVRARALAAAGSLAYWQYDQEDATRFYQASAELRRTLDDPAELASALYDLGHALTVPGWAKQDPRRGRVLELEALELYRSAGDRLGESRVLWGLGWNSHVLGKFERAIDELSHDVKLCRELGDAFGLAWALTILGLSASRVERFDLARASWREALEVFAAAGDTSGIDNVLDHLGWLAQVAGNPGRAARLAAAATRARGLSESAIVETYTRTEGRSTIGPGRLTPQEFEAAWREGEAMSTAEAVAHALAEDEAPGAVLPSGLHVYALGPMRVERLQNVIRQWGGEKAGSRQAQAIFAFLFDRGPAGVSKDEVTELLWPDLSVRRGDLAFHRTLGGLRSVLERGREASSSIRYEGGRYRLDPDLAVWSDVGAFEELLAAPAEADSRKRIHTLEEARRLYRGDLFDDCPFYGDSSAVEDRRMYLRGRLEDVVVELGERYADIGEHAAATAQFRQALAMNADQSRARAGLERVRSVDPVVSSEPRRS
jgi:predicted ATPase/DNA-binding SARP family transcriptional activator